MNSCHNLNLLLLFSYTHIYNVYKRFPQPLLSQPEKTPVSDLQTANADGIHEFL